MGDIILTCCGQAVPVPPCELDCPACGSHFAEVEVEGLQMQEIDSVPAVDVLRAARMLDQSPDWIAQRRQMLDAIPGGLELPFVFPLTAVRRFATEQSLSITPLPVGGALWIKRPS
jgi:hypothetical protein